MTYRSLKLIVGGTYRTTLGEAACVVAVIQSRCLYEKRRINLLKNDTEYSKMIKQETLEK